MTQRDDDRAAGTPQKPPSAAPMRHSSACRDGMTDGCEGWPYCFPDACVTCAAPLPQWPAFIYHGPSTTGPYCDEHAVLTTTDEETTRGA